MKSMTVVDHLRKLALRILSDSRGHMAELESAVVGALEDMNSAKQDKFTGTKGQVIGFDEKGNPVPQDGITMEQINEAITEAITGAIKGEY